MADRVVARVLSPYFTGERDNFRCTCTRTAGCNCTGIWKYGRESTNGNMSERVVAREREIILGVLVQVQLDVIVRG
jgi:hypothetical protein